MAACEHCEIAERRLWHGYNLGCRSCLARAMSNSPAFDESRREGIITPSYRQAMKTLFGQGWAGMHPEVKRWAEIRRRHCSKSADE